MKLSDSITQIPFVGSKYATLLEVLGIETIYDLLHYYPRSYVDSSLIYKFTDLSKEEKRATIGTLEKISSLKTRSRITIQKAKFSSNEGIINVTWFNQPFLKQSLKEEGTYLLLGKLNPKASYPELLSPEIEELSMDSKHIGRISPVYNLTAGIKNKWLRARIKWLIDKFDYITDFHETLPNEVINKYNLDNLQNALIQVHFPDDQNNLKKARYRLSFDEMLSIQLQIEKRRNEKEKFITKGIKIDINSIKNKISELKFSLTSDQKKVLDEILEDMNKEVPMERLLQGDVGSGKTIVAILAAYCAQLAGSKIVYMAPTTILAKQVFLEFKKILNSDNIFLISSEVKKLPEVNKHSILIGTHALLYLDKSVLENLNLIIIDEEHRFGVEQRELLSKLEKEFKPHKLSMTATPIPRSLAMTIWGDTKISYIKSKPIGRKETKTMFVPSSKIEDSHNWIIEQLKLTKTQVFWVCPLIEESDVLNAKSAEETFEKVKNHFKDFRVRLVHGKTKDKEKHIEEFKNNKYDILVTTPIIEVGIDIPNANIIVIESSERFGLAQLHQFRGRVGRSGDQGYCMLYSTESELSTDQKNRLKYFCEVNDGLKLAEYDLKRRGPGEVYGTKQSGIPDLKIADIFDEKLLEQTKETANFILKNKI